MPTHTEKRRRSVWDTLLLVVAGLMIIQGFATSDPMPVLFGGGVGAFLALTRHTRYELYQDALVIRFMAPRKIVIPLAELQDVRLRATAPAQVEVLCRLAVRAQEEAVAEGTSILPRWAI